MTTAAEKKTRPGLALCAAFLLTATLGSIHAFSIFVTPLHLIYSGSSLAAISLIYSLALVMLTLAVLVSHRLFRRFSIGQLAFAAPFLSAAGLLLAAKVPGLATMYLGYGVIFGFANGVGYALALQLAAHARPARKGSAMAAVTAVYALGALFFGKMFYIPTRGAGGDIPPIPVAAAVEQTLVSFSVIFLAVALAAALLCAASRMALETRTPNRAAAPASSGGDRLTVLLWLGYGFGCLAGLMAIGHAANIVTTLDGATPGLVAWAVPMISLGNALGGFVAGPLLDRLPQNRLLAALPLFSLVSLLNLALVDRAGFALAFLGFVGFGYGAIIAVYPAATAAFVGLADSAKIYGRVFTAWGVAGLLGPWIAGLLYDLSETYTLALLIAAAAALVSALVVRFLPRQEV